MTARDAISDDELEHLFAPLRAYRTIVLAVSGGADSTALMHLVSRWLRRAGSPEDVPRVHVATVDHGLRAESAQEAEAVAAGAASLGLRHHTLRWPEGARGPGLQERAREARYALLGDFLRELDADSAALVTAHTADDQFETVLMRLARGSGLDGMAAMAPCRRLRKDALFDLVRPLLMVRKDRLVATLRAAEVAWFEDPSNASTDFERVRIRAASEALAAIGLTPEMLALSAERAGRARQALDAMTSAAEARGLNMNGGAYGSLDRRVLGHEPAEVQVRLLTRLLARFGGAAPRARLVKIERLAERLASETGLTATLGGCVVSAAGDDVRVFREPGRGGLPVTPIAPGAAVVWDGRFSVFRSPSGVGDGPVTVRALGRNGFAGLRHNLKMESLPSRAGATLPGIWDGPTLLAVPFLGVRCHEIGCFGEFRTEFLGLPADDRISN